MTFTDAARLFVAAALLLSIVLVGVITDAAGYINVAPEPATMPVLTYDSVTHLTSGPTTTTTTTTTTIPYPTTTTAAPQIDLTPPSPDPVVLPKIAVPPVAAPIVAPAPPPAPAGAASEVDAAIESAAAEFGLSVYEMRLIANCESGFDPNIVSHTNDHGLFQHNARYAPPRFIAVGASWADRYDPLQNARAAAWYRIQLGRWGGSAGWVCARIVGLH